MVRGQLGRVRRLGEEGDPWPPRPSSRTGSSTSRSCARRRAASSPGPAARGSGILRTNRHTLGAEPGTVPGSCPGGRLVDRSSQLLGTVGLPSQLSGIAPLRDRRSTIRPCAGRACAAVPFNAHRADGRAAMTSAVASSGRTTPSTTEARTCSGRTGCGLSAAHAGTTERFGAHEERWLANVRPPGSDELGTPVFGGRHDALRGGRAQTR